MAEKRKTERLSPLVIRTQFPCGSELQNGLLTNLSEAGAFLATDASLAVGGAVKMDFDLPWGLGRHTAEAEVVWSSEGAGAGGGDLPAGVGLAFKTLAPEVRESIRRYMRMFYELLARMEHEGLSEVLARLPRHPQASGSND